MTIYSRNWQLTGQNKTSGTALAVSTTSGTAYPQVDDLLMVAWASDNASSTTPTLSTMTVTGAGAIGAVTQASSTNASATAAGDVQIGYAWARVTTAFTAASVVNLTLSTAVAAKAAVATTWFSTPTAIDGWNVTTSQAPSSATTATGAGSLDAGNQAVFAGGAVQNTTGPTYTGQQMVYVSNTTGGSAATNVRVLLAQTTAAAQVNISAAEAVFAVRAAIAAPAGPVDLFKTPADTAAGTDSVTTEQYEQPPLLGAKLWLRGKDLGDNGTPVTQWLDQSGQNNHTTVMAGSNTVATGATPSGGKVLRCNGSNIQLPAFITSGPGEIWAVLRSDALQQSWWSFGASGNENHYPYNSVVYDDFGATVRDSFAPTVDINSQHRLIHVTVAADGTKTWEIDNVQQGQWSRTIGWRATNFLLTGMPTTWLGDWAEVVVRDRVSTEPEVVDWIEYFNGQHGLTVPTAPPVDLTANPADLAGGIDSATTVLSRIVVSTPADTAAGSDSAVPVQTFLRTPGDTAAGADAPTRVADAVRAPADTAAAVDSATPVKTIDRTATDTAGGVDDAQADRAAAANVMATPADTATGADTATPVQTIDRTGADNAGGTDTATELQDYVRTPADLAGAVDTATELQTYDRTATDLATGVDLADAQFVTGAQDFFATPADMAGAVDAATSSYDRAKTAGDTAAGSDTHTVLSDDVRAAADTAAGTDALTVSGDRSRVPADLAGGTDAASAGIALDRSGSDVAGGLDTTSSTYDRPSIPADTAGAVDVVSSSQLYARLAQADDLATGSDLVTSYWTRDKTAADLAGGTDTSSVQAARAPAISDPSGGSDTTSVVADRVSPSTDTAVGSDSVNVSRTGFTGVERDDIAAGLDSATTSATRDRVLPDNASGTDAPSTARGLTPSSDLASGSDTLTTVFVRLADLVDLANGIDAVNAARTGVITWTVDDLASGSDSVGWSAGRGRSPADTAGGGDTASTTLSRPADVPDLANGTDTATLVAVRTRTAVDSAAGTDSITTDKATSIVASRADVAVGSDAASAVLYLAALTQSGVGSYPV